MLKLTMVAVLAACMGCSAAAGPAPYIPTSSLSQQEAVAVITRSLEEQPTGGATNIEVTPTKLSYENAGGRFLRGGGVRATTFFFDVLGEMDIVVKRKGSVVRVRDSDGVLRFYVVIPNPERARLFMDAMLSMARRSTSD